MAINLGFYPAKAFTRGRGRWSGRQDIVVCHITDGKAGLKEFEANPTKNPAMFSGTMGWFCLPNTTTTTSCHFITDRGGRFLNIVKLDDMAHCNGNNAITRQLKGVKPIIKSRVDNANLYTYSIESEGYAAVGDPPGTPEQLDAIFACICICIDHMHSCGVTTFVPDRDHIIGHCHIRPDNRMNCPSKNFAENYPFDYLIEKAREYCDSKYPGWIDGSSIPDDSGVIHPGEGGTTTPVVPAGIKVGDMVTIIHGATWYGSSAKINDLYINGRTYRVDDLRGNRAVLDKNGINSPIDVKYLHVVAPNDNPTTDVDNKDFAVGDKVVINAGATWYNSSALVPNWAIGNVYTIDELSGDRALIGKPTINSPISTKYLTKVSDEIRVGDKVKINAGAKWYNSTRTVPSWALNSVYTVDELSGDRALLSKTGINSAIDISYLTKV